MDLLLLDSTTYYPTALFEGYSSLIWTERFTVSGEFRLTSSRIEETLTALPVGSLISLRDTTEVMMVETYSVGPNNSDGCPEIIVSGRSLDSFLENRVILPRNYGEDQETLQVYTPQQLICFLIWNSMVNNTGQDPSHIQEEDPENHLYDPKTVVPNLVVSLGNVVEKGSFRASWTLTSGSVGSLILDIQSRYKTGICAIRPTTEKNVWHKIKGSLPSMSYNRIDFSVSLDPNYRGMPQFETVTDDVTNMRLEVYQGTDRTVTQTEVTPVTFRHDLGDISNPTYLKSIKNYKNYARVVNKSSVDPPPNPTEVPLWNINIDYKTGDRVKRIVVYEEEYWVAHSDPRGPVNPSSSNGFPDEVGEIPGIPGPSGIPAWWLYDPTSTFNLDITDVEEWDSTKVYEANAKVKYNGIYWIALRIKPFTNEVPGFGAESTDPGLRFDPVWKAFNPNPLSNAFVPYAHIGFGDENASGLNRRVLFVDGGSEPKTGVYLNNLCRINLSKHNIVTMADGEISPTNPYVYGYDYFLGDTVTFVGPYEADTPMLVNEIIRTEDENGESISSGIIHMNSVSLEAQDG